MRCGLIRKKHQFPRFPSFRFCPIPKIENAEIPENFILLKFLVAYETQNQKNDLKEKKFNFRMWFEKRKCPFRRFPGFRFFPIKNAVLKNSAIFAGKDLCWSLRPATLLKKETPTQIFSGEYCENNYFEEHMRTAVSVL